MKWIDGKQLGRFTVQKHELKRPGGQAYIPLAAPKVLIIHTTEGSTVAGALSTLGANFTGPHFVVGENRIVQTRPLDGEAATVHDHNDIGWQVECVGSAKLAEHRLTPSTWEPLVELVRWVGEQGVPLKRPDGWDDQLPPGTWANNNPRRQSRKALSFRGLVGHIEIPDQDPSWHWDPGSLDYSELIAQATGTGDDDMAMDDYIAGSNAAQQRAVKEDGTVVDPGPAPEGKPKHFQAGWSDVRWQVNRLKGRDGKDGAAGTGHTHQTVTVAGPAE
jgi:hypothetical protein